MKQKKSRKVKAAAGSRGRARTVDEYIARAPDSARGALRQLRAAIRSAVPAGTAETISYGIPAFRGEKVLVWYAAFAKHCSFFPTAAVVEAFRDDLKGHATSKGTVHFPLDKPIPTTLVKKMVKARVAQAEGK